MTRQEGPVTSPLDAIVDLVSQAGYRINPLHRGCSSGFAPNSSSFNSCAAPRDPSLQRRLPDAWRSWNVVAREYRPRAKPPHGGYGVRAAFTAESPGMPDRHGLPRRGLAWRDHAPIVIPAISHGMTATSGGGGYQPSNPAATPPGSGLRRGPSNPGPAAEERPGRSGRQQAWAIRPESHPPPGDGSQVSRCPQRPTHRPLAMKATRIVGIVDIAAKLSRSQPRACADSGLRRLARWNPASRTPARRAGSHPSSASERARGPRAGATSRPGRRRSWRRPRRRWRPTATSNNVGPEAWTPRSRHEKGPLPRGLGPGTGVRRIRRRSAAHLGKRAGPVARRPAVLGGRGDGSRPRGWPGRRPIVPHRPPTDGDLHPRVGDRRGGRPGDGRWVGGR